MINSHFKIALRALRKNALPSSLNISGLAVGFAVCLFIGLWLQRELSFDRFHSDIGRIFRVSNTFKSESESFSQAPCGPAFGADAPREIAGISSGTRFCDASGRLEYGEKRFLERKIITADSNFFRFFNFEVKKGDPNTFLNEVGNIVLTEATAFKYFGDEDPMGKMLRYDGTYDLKVSGVVANPPVNSQIQFEGVLPMIMLKKHAAANWGIPNIDELWLGGWMLTFVKLANPAEESKIESQLNALMRKKAGSEMDSFQMAYTYHLQPMADVHLNSALRYDAENNGSLSSVKVFAAIGLIVLLLACINYINLSTAGAMRRAKETGVRKVNGAARGQLIRQFLVESLLLAFSAGLLGLLLFRLGIPWFEHLSGQNFDHTFSGQIFLQLLAMCLFTGLLAGAYPALVISGFKTSQTLKGAFQTSTRGIWLRKTLVIVQFTATIALLAAVGVVWQQMRFIQQKSLGFTKEAVIEVDHFGSDEVVRQFRAIRQKLLDHPAIHNAAYHGGTLVGGMGNGWTTTVDLKGKEISTSLYQMGVSPEYFDTYGMQLVAGRFFSGEVASDTTKAVLVNEAAVKTFGWQKPENALGKPFGKGEDAKQVIGVVKDFHFENLHKAIEPMAIHLSPRGGRFSLRAESSQLSAAIQHLEKTWQAFVPGIPLEFRFMDDAVAKQYGAEQTTQRLFLVLAALALFIACLGLFGLATYLAQQRTKEIGIRKVLGASASSIVNLLSQDFIKLVLISIVVASPLAYWAMSKWLANFAYHINVPWWVFVVAGLLAILVAFFTIASQAMRAAFTNPVKSLRSE